MFLLENKKYKYKLDFSNLSKKNRLLLFAYINKILIALKNIYEENELYISPENLLYGFSISNNYNYSVFDNLIAPYLVFYDINNPDDVIEMHNANKIKELKYDDIGNILKVIYEEVYITCKKNDDNKIKLKLNEDLPLYRILDIYSFINKIEIAVCNLHGVNSIEYLFKNFLITKEQQEDCLFNGFLLMVDVSSNDFNIFYKIMGEEVNTNIGYYINQLYNFKTILEYTNSKVLGGKVIDINSFITPDNMNMCYNTLIKLIENKVKENENKVQKF